MLSRMKRYVNSSEYLRELKDAVFLRNVAGRALTIFPDDVFLVSYPRSGNTWARFLIANLLQTESGATFDAVDHLVPDIYLVTDRALRHVTRPRFLKSHEPFDPRYPRVVYLVRDPRDVIISRYYYALKWQAFPDGYPMEEFVHRFISGGADQYHRTGPWGDHVLSWLAMRVEHPSFLLLRYEDLRRDTAGKLAQLVSFLKLEVDDAKLARAVTLSSPERMRELDRKEPFRWLRNARHDVPFVRQAAAGGWESQLPESVVQEIESAWWPLMRALGYEPVTLASPGVCAPTVDEAICASFRLHQLRAASSGVKELVPQGGRE